MALTMDCINVFYQPNDFIPFLSMFENYSIKNWNNKEFSLITKWFNIKTTNLWKEN